MTQFEDKKQLFVPQQFGFRSKHSTAQQIIRLAETISFRFNQDKSTALTLLDLEKSFDSVWHNGLLHKLLISGYFTKIESLHAMSGVPTVREFIKKLTEKFYKSCEESGNVLIKKLGDYTERSQSILRFKHKMPKRLSRQVLYV